MKMMGSGGEPLNGLGRFRLSIVLFVTTGFVDYDGLKLEGWKTILKEIKIKVDRGRKLIILRFSG